MECHFNPGILDVHCKCEAQALEKAQPQLNLLSEQYKVVQETLIERKPQLLRFKDDIAKALEQKVISLSVRVWWRCG